MSSLLLSHTQIFTKPRSIRNIMSLVMIALLPGTIAYSVLIDLRVMANIAIAILASLLIEAACLALRKRLSILTLSDGSMVLAAWLYALCLPPNLPSWQLIVGCFCLVILGKHLFGGLGHNPFNPAMVAYTFLLIAFPVTVTSWPQADQTVNQQIQAPIMTSHAPPLHIDDDVSWDGISGATVLDKLRTYKRNMQQSLDEGQYSSESESLQDWETHYVIAQKHYSDTASQALLASTWLWVNIAWLLGGVFLLWAGVISWHTPLSLLVSVTVLYSVFQVMGIGLLPNALFALSSGAIIIGAFFIATDPVSGPSSRQGQLIFGAGIGILTFTIREFSDYPEGLAFAVLLMNLCVPLIDYLSIGKNGRLIQRR